MWRRAPILAVLLAVTAHAAPRAEELVTPTQAELAKPEGARDKRPDRGDRRDELALAYYRFARAAFDRGELPVYEDYLERAMREWVESLRIDPENRTSSDLAAYRCGSPACGPYLARACGDVEIEVAQRQLPEETALRELRIEMERRRELERIYRERKDLDIKVKTPETDASADAQPSAAQEPHP